MEPEDPIEDDPSYHSHKPGERRFSEDPVVFPEKEPEVEKEPQPDRGL
jgi:hypothetical protein